MKYKIFDYIARTASKKRGGPFHEISQYAPPGLYEPEWDQHLHDNWQEKEYLEVPYDQRELIATIIKAVTGEQRESFAAVIKHNFQKKGKGKGKGKKG